MVFAIVLCANVVFCNEIGDKKLNFLQNKGQWDKIILYKTSLNNSTIFLHSSSITIDLYDRQIPFCNHKEGKKKHKDCDKENEIIFHHAIQMQLINSLSPKIIASKKSKTYNNYYIGNDPSFWAEDVHYFADILYKGIYNDIDWRIYSKEDNLKHDFIIHKNGRVEDIYIRYKGVDKLKIEKGNLIIKTSIRDIVELKPVAYQIIDGEKVNIEVLFSLEKDIISYKVFSYDRNYDLIIDPELIFSSYTGSSADNWGFTATHDRLGNVYLGGIVASLGYPTTLGAYQTTFSGGGWDVSISKFNKTGTELLFSTYLGGQSAEMPHSLIVNEFDELVVFGTTGSGNFPTTENAFQRTFAQGDSISLYGAIIFRQGCDMFVSKFNSSGTNLIASTYIGGSGNDGINFKNRYNAGNIMYNGNDSLYSNYGDGARGELITDDRNNIYVGSCSFSQDFPTTPNAFQPLSAGKQEGVVFKLDYSLSTLLFSSFLGGENDDAIYSIDTDKDYNLYVTGGTSSHNFPTTLNSFSPSFNGGKTDGFVALISYEGNHLLSSTFFGTSSNDQSFFVRVDKNNNPHIYGQTFTQGTNLIYNAAYSSPNSGQFIAKFSPNLSQRLWSTKFGSQNGMPNISPSAFAVDICNRIYAAGWGGFGNLVTSNMPTTSNAFQTSTDGRDFYIIALDENASSLQYATFMGANSIGDHVDGGTSRFDRYGNIYQAACAGCEGNQGFPTFPDSVVGPTNNSSNCNAAIFVYNINNDFPVSEFSSPNVGCLPLEINFENTSRGEEFLWNFGDGTTSNDENPSHIYTNAGLYEVELISYMPNGCITSDTMTKTILVLSDTSFSLPQIMACPNVPTQIGIAPLMDTSVTFTWNPSSLVSDPSISNPFIITSQNTNMQLIVSSSNCKDTIWQMVRINFLSLNVPDTINTCNSPEEFSISDQYDAYIFSLDRNFNNRLNEDSLQNSISLFLEQSHYLYVKTYKDGCFGMDSIWINFTGMILNLDITNPLCYNSQDGSVKAIPIGGTSPYIYYLNDEASSSNTINNLTDGTYSIIVQDNNGCRTKKEFTISSPEPLTFTATKKDNPCQGVEIGQIIINPQGGISPYHILWDDNTTSFTKDNLPSGVYSFTIIDNNACQKRDSIEIITKSILTTSIIKEDVNCLESCQGTITINPSGGESPYAFSWSNNNEGSIARNLCKGTYYVRTMDKNGCFKDDTIEIINHDLFNTFEVSASANEIFDGEVIFLNATYITNMTYLWSPSKYINNPNSYSTTAMPMEDMVYHVIVTDNRGCKREDSIFIKVNVVDCSLNNIFVPNVFTPNGDGKNDKLLIYGENIKRITFIIFNRWGEEVFRTNNSKEGWDGNYKGEAAPAGVYYYRLEVECLANRSLKHKGDITLIR
jgi:gliding motility-associated-like protein